MESSLSGVKTQNGNEFDFTEQILTLFVYQKGPVTAGLIFKCSACVDITIY